MAERAREARAVALANYIVMLCALARKHGETPQSLANWVIQQFEDHGYYAESAAAGQGLEQFVRHFVEGRKLLYDDVVQTIGADHIEVVSRQWFLAEDALPESIYYFDMDFDYVLAYIRELARLNAARSGMVIDIEHLEGLERAVINRARVAPGHGTVART